MKFRTRGVRLAGLLVPALALAAPAFAQVRSPNLCKHRSCHGEHWHKQPRQPRDFYRNFHDLFCALRERILYKKWR